MVGMLFIFIIILMAFALNFRIAQEDAARVQGQLVRERDVVDAEKDRLASERDRLAHERDQLAAERDRLAEQRDTLGGVTDRPLERPSGAPRHARDGAVAVAASVRSRSASIPRPACCACRRSCCSTARRRCFDPEGRRALQELAAVLARTLPCYSHAPQIQQGDCPSEPQALLEAVLVEGHTDDVPISTTDFVDNWELASTRAINTYKALMSFQPSLGDLQNGSGEDLLGVSGYEAHRPVSLEADAHGPPPQSTDRSAVPDRSAGAESADRDPQPGPAQQIALRSGFGPKPRTPLWPSARPACRSRSRWSVANAGLMPSGGGGRRRRPRGRGADRSSPCDGRSRAGREAAARSSRDGFPIDRSRPVIDRWATNAQPGSRRKRPWKSWSCNRSSR